MRRFDEIILYFGPHERYKHVVAVAVKFVEASDSAVRLKTFEIEFPLPRKRVK